VVSELRYGIKASVEHFFDGMNGCTGLWVVDHGCNEIDDEGKSTKRHYATFAVTLPPETLLIRIVRTQQGTRGAFPGLLEDGAWEIDQISVNDDAVPDGVMRDVETVEACCWSDDLAVQITHNEIRSLRRPSLRQVKSIAYVDSLLRAVCTPGFPYIAVAFRTSGEIHLEMVQILQDGTLAKAPSKKARLRLDHDPTCVEIFQAASAAYVFISTFDSKVRLLRIEEDGSLVQEAEGTLENAAVGDARILLESAVLLYSGTMQILVCATRSGYLLSSRLPLKKSSEYLPFAKLSKLTFCRAAVPLACRKDGYYLVPDHNELYRPFIGLCVMRLRLLLGPLLNYRPYQT
jgi:hypothetical protein